MNAFTLRNGKELDNPMPKHVSKKDQVSSEEVEVETPLMLKNKI